MVITLWEQTELLYWEVLESFLIGRLSFSLSPTALPSTEGTAGILGGHKTIDVCKSGRETFPESLSDSALILDCRPPSLWRLPFCYSSQAGSNSPVAWQTRLTREPQGLCSPPLPAQGIRSLNICALIILWIEPKAKLEIKSNCKLGRVWDLLLRRRVGISEYFWFPKGHSEWTKDLESGEGKGGEYGRKGNKYDQTIAFGILKG